MDVLVALGLFILSVGACLLLDWSILYGLLVGLAAFLLLAHGHGQPWRALPGLVWQGVRTALPVVGVMLCIGCLTALWRASGTIGYCVAAGLELLSPRLFLLIAFVLPAGLSFLLGTSFGVAGTAGVVLMALARSGGADLLLTAGAVLSGAYFGDRCSPASSAGMLACKVCGVPHGQYVRMMLRTSLLPVLVCLAIYGALSVTHPLIRMDDQVLQALGESFRLSWVCLLPALVLLILPWCGLPIFYSLAGSAGVGLALALTLQQQPIGSTLLACVVGWQAPAGPLAATLSGGGMVSMATACGVVLLSNAYSGLFRAAHLLGGLERRLSGLADRVGLFPTQLLTALLTGGVFCNQAIGTVLGAQLLSGVYQRKGASNLELAVDIGSSIMTLAGLIPWSVASAVPLAMLGASTGALGFAVYLYAVPLCYLATRSHWFPGSSRPGMERKQKGVDPGCDW